MRLLYQHIIQKISKKRCRLVIESLKGGVAIDFRPNLEQDRSSALQVDTVYKFLTTSRPVEKWLQRVETNIYKMANNKKVSPELLMVIGGYGAGKSHIKEYLRRNRIQGVEFLELRVSPLWLSEKNQWSTIDNIFSLTLLQFREYLDTLYDVINKNSLSPYESNNEIRRILEEYSIDDQFIQVFCDYGQLSYANRSDYKPLEEIMIKKAEQIYLPLMRLYKRYLGINGVCIVIDEFEDLQHLPTQKWERFAESIRTFYDSTMASNLTHADLPSFKMIILCTLSFWAELIRDTRSQALETRVKLLEIPPLTQDEIMALAEKLYVLYVRAGYLKSEIDLDSNKLLKYLVERAGLEAPLTPRFVISQIITIIENPDGYIRYLYQ